jgi:type I restriction enzyme S subunit
MGSEWRKVSLLDYYESKSGLSKPAKDFGSGFPFLSFKDVFYNYFIPEELIQLVQSSEKERESCSVKRGDIFLTRTSETMNELGMSSVALKDYENATFNGFSKRLRPKDNCPFHPEFIGYYLRSPQFRSDMLSFSTMSTRASLNNDMIGRLTAPVPSFKEQKNIAWILKKIDNKIQLNRETNQTLEAMAQALFKSWFVDFDPVFDNIIAHNLAHNNAPLHNIPEPLLPHAQRRLNVLNEGQHNADNVDRGSARQVSAAHAFHHLFPQAFEQSDEPSVGIQGWVPKGWGVKNITELADTISNTYPLKTVDKVIFLNTGDIEAGNFLHKNYSEASTLPGQAKKMIQKDDILYSEIRPKNKRFAYVYFDGTEHVVSTKLMVLRAKEKANSRFVYFLLTLNKTISDLQRIAELRSGTFPQITYNELSLIKAAIPSDGNVLKTFSNIMLNTYYNKNLQIQAQNEELKNLRDTLLPKLISGELRIPDAEQVSEALAK